MLLLYLPEYFRLWGSYSVTNNHNSSEKAQDMNWLMLRQLGLFLSLLVSQTWCLTARAFLVSYH